jgi:thiamine-phosphate pyrophosphorylase
MKKIKDHSLYLIISEEYCRGKSALETAAAAMAGGVDIIQMREKNRPRGGLLDLGKRLAALCKEGGALFIVNDDPALAVEAGADGVHLGQEDLKQFSVGSAREIMGKDKIIGVSTHSVEEFEKANGEDIDYIAYGPIFPTKTKDYFLGANDVPKILEIARKPVFLIGGISLSNIDELLAMGAANIAMIRGITEAEDMANAVGTLKKRLLCNDGQGERKIKIKINGKDESVDKSANIAELISKKGLSCDKIIVEHNLRIVPKDEWAGIALQENDNIEIVSFVGGG